MSMLFNIFIDTQIWIIGICSGDFDIQEQISRFKTRSWSNTLSSVNSDFGERLMQIKNISI